MLGKCCGRFSDSFFLICIVGGGVQTGSTRHVGHLLAYCTCPDATLSTTNPTWPDPGLNPDRRGGKPATNRFSYGAAFSDSWQKKENFKDIYSRILDLRIAPNIPYKPWVMYRDIGFSDFVHRPDFS
jgi:hypothetical protein